ncbi:MAG: hypothetical protein WDW38_010967 [Sanguina aurantia]
MPAEPQRPLQAVRRSATREIFKESQIQLAWIGAHRATAGLVNLGNTCFMNSVLQCLANTAPLAQLFLADHDYSKAVGDAIEVTQQYVKRAFTGSTVMKPVNHAKMLRQLNKRFRLGRQEDAHEFLRCLVDAMHEVSLKGITPKPSPELCATTLIHRVFGGRLRSQVRCEGVDYQSNTYDPFLDLSLEINRAQTLTKALQLFTAAEVLDGANKYRCPTNNKLDETYHNCVDAVTLGAKPHTHTYGAQIGIPIVAFSIGTYWDSYYRSRPFYGDRRSWYSRPYVRRAPPPPPRGFNPGRPGYGRPDGRNDWHGNGDGRGNDNNGYRPDQGNQRPGQGYPRAGDNPGQGFQRPGQPDGRDNNGNRPGQGYQRPAQPAQPAQGQGYQRPAGGQGFQRPAQPVQQGPANVTRPVPAPGQMGRPQGAQPAPAGNQGQPNGRQRPRDSNPRDDAAAHDHLPRMPFSGKPRQVHKPAWGASMSPQMRSPRPVLTQQQRGKQRAAGASTRQAGSNQPYQNPTSSPLAFLAACQQGLTAAAVQLQQHHQHQHPAPDSSAQTWSRTRPDPAGQHTLQPQTTTPTPMATATVVSHRPHQSMHCPPQTSGMLGRMLSNTGRRIRTHTTTTPTPGGSKAKRKARNEARAAAAQQGNGLDDVTLPTAATTNGDASTSRHKSLAALSLPAAEQHPSSAKGAKHGRPLTAAAAEVLTPAPHPHPTEPKPAAEQKHPPTTTPRAAPSPVSTAAPNALQEAAPAAAVSTALRAPKPEVAQVLSVGAASTAWLMHGDGSASAAAGATAGGSSFYGQGNGGYAGGGYGSDGGGYGHVGAGPGARLGVGGVQRVTPWDDGLAEGALAQAVALRRAAAPAPASATSTKTSTMPAS